MCKKGKKYRLLWETIKESQLVYKYECFHACFFFARQCLAACVSLAFQEISNSRENECNLPSLKWIYFFFLRI